jgi:hypothetical protein
LKQTLATRLSHWVYMILTPSMIFWTACRRLWVDLMMSVQSFSWNARQCTTFSASLENKQTLFGRGDSRLCEALRTQSQCNDRHCWWHTFFSNPDAHKQCELHRKEPAHDSTESEGVTPRSTENSNPQNGKLGLLRTAGRSRSPQAPHPGRLWTHQSPRSLRGPLAARLRNCLPLMYHKPCGKPSKGSSICEAPLTPEPFI